MAPGVSVSQMTDNENIWLNFLNTLRARMHISSQLSYEIIFAQFRQEKSAQILKSLSVMYFDISLEFALKNNVFTDFSRLLISFACWLI